MVDRSGWPTLGHTCVRSLRRSPRPGTGTSAAGMGLVLRNFVLGHLNDVCGGDPEAEPEVVAVTMGDQAGPFWKGRYKL